MQCRYCLNTDAFRGCNSATCRLNNHSLSNLKRIKAHCQECIGATSSHAVKKCDGKLLAGVVCSLHLYRLGHNSKRQGIGGKKRNSQGVLSTVKRLTE